MNGIYSTAIYGRCWRREEFTLDDFKPITSMYWWHTFDGVMQRFAFAFTMGSAAVVLNALLWLLSMPWIAWRLVRWIFSEVPTRSVYEGPEILRSLRLKASCTLVAHPLNFVQTVVPPLPTLRAP